ncbi:uncharacterized protein ColSpa_08261 [Colletotrichum spaethianum]|uniref:BTB domain-containing protein n=1 Tax=Colletotrichum spaethianum TaxID=700344 RepID=A0AA37P9D9_9PEZI|nr:uncharacterized protein ColSpa_08261 [Colletotrichum spaethianum]GKT48080.1 hypothetical protein ColSpa_08261 [Colletotrichum spaethianum]
MVVNANVLVSPWRCEVSSVDEPRPHSATTTARQSIITDPRYSKEIFETCSLSVKFGNSYPNTLESAFATSMSNKKSGVQENTSPDSLIGEKSRRGRLSALFGREPEASDDTVQDSTAAKEVESIKDGLDNPVEQDYKLQQPVFTQKSDHNNEMAQDSKSPNVAAHHAYTSAANTTAATDFADISQSIATAEVSEDETAASQNSDNHSAVDDVNPQTTSNLLTPSRAMKLPIRRHKKSSSSFKIVDRETADAVLLPASTYSHWSNKNHDSIHSKKHADANGGTQTGQFDQQYKVDRKNDEEIQPPQSTSYTAISSSDSTHVRASHYSKVTAEDPHLLPSISYSVPAASRNKPILVDEGLLSSTSYIESDPTRSISHAEEMPVEGNRLLSSTSYTDFAPLHGVLKAPNSDKTLADKKVRFAVASSSKTFKDEDNDKDSDDSDSTIKLGVGGTKAALESILSPVLWDKGSEPKIWLKDGKPTLFQPKKEPDYYTNPLWSRQYPEILSNNPPVSPQTSDCAKSTTSTDGSRHSKTPTASSDTNFNMGTNLHMNTGSYTDMSFDTGTPAPQTAFTRISGGTNTLPTPTNQTFVGRGFPEQRNTPTSFALTPRYRAQVKLEVGGRRFVSTFEVLAKSPWFRHLFSVDFRNWYHDGVFHIDNDGDLFAHVLRYLRTDLYPLFWDSNNGFDYAMYAMIRQQAHHYMLYDLETWILAQKFHDVVETQVVHQKVIVPHDQAWNHEHRLMGNHSYVISGVADHVNPETNLQRNAQNAAAGYCQSDNGENSGSKGKARDVAALDLESGGAVALFITEKMVKVDMDQLRRF